MNFEESFRRGFVAAETARVAKAEIEAVFTDLNQQLYQASNGAAWIDIRKKEEMKRPRGVMETALASIGQGQYVNYKAIVVAHRSQSGFPPIEVARWRDSQEGYPCWISTEDNENYCTDKESLIESLTELCATAKVGEAVLSAMKYTPP